MRNGRLAALAVAVAVAASGLSVTLAFPAAAAIADPVANVSPSPDYWPTCTSYGPSSAACTTAVVAAINHARSLEGVGPMQLPTGFASMTTAEQAFVVSNLERVDRGLQPAAGMVATLDSSAQTAASHDADPTLSSWTIGSFNANRWGSNWAGDLNALAADYDWMYADGWGTNGSFNMDCTGPGAAGCWGHRHNILSSYGGEELITGTGSVAQSQWTSIAQIFVAGSGAYPAFVLSWASVMSQSAAAAMPPGTTVPPSASQDAAAVTIGTTTSVVAGHTASVSGHVVDAVTGTPAAGAGVFLCHRSALETTGSCASMLTDSTGTVRLTVHPLVRTSWWVVFPGTSSLAAASSRANIIYVKNAVGVSVARATTGWRMAASFAPIRGQLVRLQVRSSASPTGWVTLVKTPLRTRTMAFHIGRGRYRVSVAAVQGLLANTVYVAVR
ncbi:MAG: hypothetical protein QOC82_493 [Frankiaceae bacterium]|nr:hypothetical protein [Frankiaceae bacterium]